MDIRGTVLRPTAATPLVRESAEVAPVVRLPVAVASVPRASVATDLEVRAAVMSGLIGDAGSWPWPHSSPLAACAAVAP